ncbi:MAG: hypothetical protein ABIK86_05155 [candidate division WOR-3 bacterium]
MSAAPISPRLLKCGIVVADVASAALKRVIVLQYNPEMLTRTLQVQTAGGEGTDRVEPMRLKGPPIETYKLDAVIDATDQLEFPSNNPAAVEAGVSPQLAALEALVYPTSAQLQQTDTLANSGTLEIIPPEAPLTLFIWSSRRIVPVRVTEFSITEEAFDAALNPIRAKVSLGLRVLSVTDLGFNSKGGSIYMAYHQQKEKLAAMFRSGELANLGIGGIS